MDELLEFLKTLGGDRIDVQREKVYDFLSKCDFKTTLAVSMAAFKVFQENGMNDTKWMK